MVYEANIRGVELLAYDNWLKRGNKVVFEIKHSLPSDVFRENLQGIGEKLGIRYGWTTIGGILLTRPGLGEDGSRSFICSEFTKRFIRSFNERIESMKVRLTKDLKHPIVQLGIKKHGSYKWLKKGDEHELPDEEGSQAIAKGKGALEIVSGKSEKKEEKTGKSAKTYQNKSAKSEVTL
jgi:hypothetical protein